MIQKGTNHAVLAEGGDAVDFSVWTHHGGYCFGFIYVPVLYTFHASARWIVTLEDKKVLRSVRSQDHGRSVRPRGRK